MDATQDSADVQILTLSPDYLASAACRPGEERWNGAGPDFPNRRCVSVVTISWDLAEEIRCPIPVQVSFIYGANAGQWELPLRACGASLGADAPHWLEARK